MLTQSRYLRWSLVILIVFLIVWLVDIQQTWKILKGTDLRWLALAFIVVQVQVLSSAIRWWITANRLGQSLGLQRAISEYYLATLANLSLPGGVGGDAARVYRNRVGGSWRSSMMSVTIERMSGQLVLFVVTLVGWLLWPLVFEQAVPKHLPQVLGIFLLLCVMLVAIVALFGRLSLSVRRFIIELSPALKRVWLVDSQWLLQSALSVAIVASYVGVFAICALSIAEPLPLAALFTVVPVVLLSMVIPLSVGGWGIRELAAASLWPVVGLTAEAGIASSIVYGLVSMVSVIPGAVLYLLMKKQA